MKHWRILILLAILIMIPACSFNTNAEGPSLQEWERELQKRIPQGSEWITLEEDKPLILIGDLDGDHQEEAITFFKNKEKKDKITALILSLKKKKLFQKEHECNTYTFSIPGKELDHASLAQWEKEYPYSHLIIGVVTQTGDKYPSPSKTIYVLDLSTEDKKERFKGTYQEIIVDDLDQDQQTDIVLFDLTESEFETKYTGVATLYQPVDDKLLPSKPLEVDSFTSIVKIQSGKLDQERKGIFLNTHVGAHGGKVNVIVLEDGRLKPLFFSKHPDAPKLFQAYPYEAKDINNDGILEIPEPIAPIRLSGDWAMADTPWILHWYQVTGNNRLKKVTRTYEGNGFRFEIPPTWPDEEFTIEELRDEELEEGLIFNSTLFFYYIDLEETGGHTPEDAGVPYFLVIDTIKNEEWEDFKKLYNQRGVNFTILAEAYGKKYIGIFPSDEEKKIYIKHFPETKKGFITPEEAKKRFTLQTPYRP